MYLHQMVHNYILRHLYQRFPQSGIPVSSKTESQFPNAGQSGHGSRIIHLYYHSVI